MLFLLQSTIWRGLMAKLAVLARRLASWAIRTKSISSAQKGFLPYEGCAEHSFVIRSVIEDSKRRQKVARVVWLDLQNGLISALRGLHSYR